jgi:hypothetical protein
MHRAVEAPGLGEVLGGAEQHGGMPVVAAGMHAPGMLRAVGEFIQLVQVQRIHIGAQPDRPVAGANLQGADDAGLGQATMHLDPE